MLRFPVKRNEEHRADWSIGGLMFLIKYRMGTWG